MISTSVAGRTWHFSHAIGRRQGGPDGFMLPIDVAIAPDGVLFVLSRGDEGPWNINSPRRRITKVTIDQEVIGEYGKSEFVWAAGIAVARDGNVYVSDEYQNSIMVFSPDGPFFYQKGDLDPGGERIVQWGGRGSEEGKLDGPTGLAFDEDDNLYVVDARNDRVQKFTKDGRFLTCWGSTGTGEGQFNRPWGVTTDREGYVYIADWGNNRVQKFTSDGVFKMSFPSSNGDANDLNHPADVAVDGQGDVYVSDWGNKRVQIYDSDGEVLTALYGDATRFSKSAERYLENNPDTVRGYRMVRDLTVMGRFDRPVGIAVDKQDRIVITDIRRGRLQVYAKDGDFIEPPLTGL